MKINYQRLSHCPKEQLVRANPTDAGWDLAAAETTIIKDYFEFAFEWEIFPVESWQQFVNYNLEGLYTGIPTADLVGEGKDLSEKLDETGCFLDLTYITDTNEDKYLLLEPKELEHCDTIELIEIKNIIASYLGKLVVARKKHKPKMIPTGICLAAEELVNFQIRLRSSMTKRGIAMAHSVGTIDFSYNNELFIPVYALGENTIIMAGEKIAQLIPAKQIEAEFVEVTPAEFVNSGRGGFGSTGT